MASRTILAETHVLGSLRGYGTVAASRGVAPDEARELESFQFGDASTAERIARLETHAVMTGRALRSGRFAVSRMMPAGFDDAGRPTVEVITLLFEARDLAFVVGAIGRLASDAEFWRGARATAGDGARVEADDGGARDAARDPRVLRLFDLWRAALRDGAVGVVPESESATVLALAAALDPADRARLRFGIGLLSLSAPVDLCAVASGTSLHGARPALRPAAEGAWHCGEESEYAAFRASSGRAHLPSVAEVESQGRTHVLEEEDSWRAQVHRGDARGAVGGDDDARARRLMPLAIGSAALSTVVLAFALTMWSRRENTASGEARVSAPSSSPRGTPRDGLADPLAGEMPKAPTEVELPKVESAREEQAGEPGNEPKAEPPKNTENEESQQTDGSEKKPTDPPKEPPSGEGDGNGEKASPPGPPSPPSIDLSSEAQIDATLRGLKKISQLRLPSDEELAGLSSEHERVSRLNLAHQRAEDAGRVVAEQFLTLAALDSSLKRSAKKVWESSARETKADVYTASLNGFICTKSRIGPGGNDLLLNRNLMKRWLKVLSEIERIRPSGLAQGLTAHWDQGVEGVRDAVLRSDVDWSQKRAIVELLRSTQESAFTQERKRVEVVLAKPELTD